MSLAEDARKAAAVLVDHEYVRIVARAHDGDALAATLLLALALTREGVDFHYSPAPAFDGTVAARLADERNEALVLIDCPELTSDATTAVAGTVVALHDADDVPAETDALLVTAERAEFHGGMDCSASALAYAVATALTKRNEDLAPLAVAGALAEGQHASGGLKGLPAEFAAQAVAHGALVANGGLALAGRDLLSTVAQGVEPFFFGLAGRARQAQRFLTESRLTPEADPGKLAGDDARRVRDVLALRLIEGGAPEAAVDAVTLPAWHATAGAFADEPVHALAASCRAAAATDASADALAWVWAREAPAPRFVAAQERLRDVTLAALVRAQRSPDGGTVVATTERGFVRAVADLGALAFRGPVVAHAPVGDDVIAAVRATRLTVASGVDVGATSRAAAAAAGGAAFGNQASAWARVPAAAWPTFQAAVTAPGESS